MTKMDLGEDVRSQPTLAKKETRHIFWPDKFYVTFKFLDCLFSLQIF